MDRQSRQVPAEQIHRSESDPDVDIDVLAVHKQAFRETGDPIEGAEAGPWWFYACAIAAIAFGGFYMGRYTGVFQGAAAVHAPVGPEAMLAARNGGSEGTAREVSGATVFSGTCAACHQASGQGSPGMFPPLAGSELVQGDEAKLIRLVLHGLSGPVTVKGQTYNGQMPPWNQLSDAELAAVLTYIRSSFGNSAPAVTADKVAAERTASADRHAPWTADELGR
jgi:mono/diheme cytochrome c family protein